MPSLPSLNCESIREEPLWFSGVQNLRSVYLAPNCIFRGSWILKRQGKYPRFMAAENFAVAAILVRKDSINLVRAARACNMFVDDSTPIDYKSLALY
jgi:hypothetical protein